MGEGILDPYELLAKEGSLTAALAALAEEMNGGFDPATRAMFDQLIDWLRDGSVGKSAIKAGDRFPDFMLPDHNGRLVTAVELLSQRPLVLSFFRGDWCPYCELEMAAIELARPAIEAAGAQIIGVTPETYDFSALSVQAHQLGYPLLSDMDNGLALMLGLVFRMPQRVIDAFCERGLDLTPRHGNDGWMLPVPGSFVIDQNGVVQLAFVEPDYRIRLEPEELLAALKRL